MVSGLVKMACGFIWAHSRCATDTHPSCSSVVPYRCWCRRNAIAAGDAEVDATGPLVGAVGKDDRLGEAGHDHHDAQVQGELAGAVVESGAVPRVQAREEPDLLVRADVGPQV